MKLNTYLTNRCLIITFLLLSISIVNGQKEIERYKSESIYLKGYKYVKNGIEYPIGYWGQHLKKEMEVSPDALAEYRVFEQNRKRAFILSILSLAAVGSAIYVENKDIQSGMLIGGMGLAIVNFPISRKAGHSFQKAIWIRNGDIIN